MKKYVLICLAIGLILSLGSIAMAGTDPGSGIQNTAHDLSLAGGSAAGAAYGDATEQAITPYNGDRICIYCHTPHNAKKSDANFTYVPLWNHAETTNVGLFVPYSNGTDNALFDPSNIAQRQHMSTAMTLFTTGQPGSVSLLCLSCHDGSVAVNSYGTVVGANKIASTAPTSIGFGGDLSNHHPIGFDYTVVAAADYEIAPVTTAVVAKHPGGTMGPQTVGDLLWAGTQMECVTCHDVHNTQNAGTKFTWVNDQNSAFCLTCHLKGANAP